MYTTYRLNSDDLDEHFLVSLKALFRGKTIEIAVCEAEDASQDETAYLLRDPANRERLLEAMANVRDGRVVSVDADALG